tara:strand:+ start:7613 stop:8626 length:1014 start_codon:yes stop_codon:yes gene_type:complete
MQKQIDWDNGEENFRDLGLTWMSLYNRMNFCTDYPNMSHNEIQDLTRDQLEVINPTGLTDKVYIKQFYKTLPDYWRFHKDEVNYKFNSDGFRAPEFDKVDWKNSYVILGCSHVFGTGNPDNETIGAYISNKLNEPVINLGVGGTGFETTYNNLLKQIHTYGFAKGYFIHWSYASRKMLTYNHTSEEGKKSFWNRRDYIPANAPKDLYSKDFLTDLMYRRNIIQHSVRQILKGIPYADIQDPRDWCIRSEKDIKRTEGEDKYSITIKVPTPVLGEFDGVHGGYIKWDQYPVAYKKWWLNEIQARDIKKYNPQTGPRGGHWGRLVNKYIAEHLIDKSRQ